MRWRVVRSAVTSPGVQLNPRHVGRYRQIAMLLLRHGRGDLVSSSGLDDVLSPDELPPGDVAAAESLAGELEAMGPTFIKLGQLLSSRVDLLPQAYTEALARLQDDVEPFGFDEVEQIVSSELGVRLSRAFSRFDHAPIAAASLGSGAPRRHARRSRGGREGAATWDPPAGARRHGGAGRDRRLRRGAQRDRAPLRRRRPAGAVPQVTRRRARLPARGPQPRASARSAERDAADRRPRADRGLHHQPRAHDGVRAGQEGHRPRPARPARSRRRRAGRRPDRRLHPAGARGRCVPRRPAPRQRAAHARRAAGAHRPRHGGPHPGSHARQADQADHGVALGSSGRGEPGDPHPGHRAPRLRRAGLRAVGDRRRPAGHRDLDRRPRHRRGDARPGAPVGARRPAARARAVDARQGHAQPRPGGPRARPDLQPAGGAAAPHGRGDARPA